MNEQCEALWVASGYKKKALYAVQSSPFKEGPGQDVFPEELRLLRAGPHKQCAVPSGFEGSWRLSAAMSVPGLRAVVGKPDQRLQKWLTEGLYGLC